ncbi:penicillin-binding protein 2 [Verminephrobacter aporrectodeae subsp. tuberculatae]|uniref:penicillin-binding protein 2 n=1 Tax=Verminephrobacter aporrectodeae TaxID=1110389 RepID=UPI002242DCE0|nr:penicillin-binding protein 2 [Verminephrobacter aporrectodeae]MCW8165283.1 penicillin-binding protein 2 [Verminephrobacter aporrectodeae subsp. tuberculatae]MCW8169419.1 penicillin-binding protein 2 [Verminephrobacter aporrectodeae subsp. tuberculatae]
MTELRNSLADTARFQMRALAVGILALAAFCVLTGRLFFLQVLRHEDLAAQAESNRTAVVPIVPGRGLILDRNGVVLASNYSAYTLEITPAQAGDLDETIAELSRVVEIQPRDRRRFKQLLEQARNFESLPIRTRLSEQEVARFAAQRYRFPGVDIKARLFRNYPLGEVASHAIGYIGRINQNEKTRIQDSDDEANYRGTEYIGKLGIEQSFEPVLHGSTGVEQMETSAGGRAVRSLSSYPATPGDAVLLALDIRLQKLVEDLFGARRGALVAIDPRSGEVLALVSKPTFDPNLFVEGIDVENWTALNESPDKPLLNRALRGTYPPGSTYKPFMALAALESGKRTPSAITQDNGSWSFGGHVFRSHSDHGLGAVDMHRSIVQSSNVYYYALANDMGVDLMHDFMQPLGFGQITGIDLHGELRGLLPSREWKRNAYRRPGQGTWYAGETISLGIGQGYNSFTTLQLAHATATLANAGLRHRPHLAIATLDAVTQERRPLAREPAVDLHYRPENLEVVRRALVGVTQEGTSARAFAGARYLSAGKTGTAQAVSIGQKDRYNAARLQEQQRDHALYIAFAPANEPRIALAVLVENAGWGAGVAAPIARRVFDYWLLGEYPSEEDMLAVQKGAATAPIGKPRLAADVPLVEP